MLLDTVTTILVSAVDLLLESAPYILFGLFISGLLRVFLPPSMVSRHLGHGRIRSVFNAALIGIPLPLCSCGVLPAAAGLRKQGANPGATTAFLIATPESGVDSISITYALLDPLMTIVRPVTAFLTAFSAGTLVNVTQSPTPSVPDGPAMDLTCPVDGCCDGKRCPPDVHRRHHTHGEKLVAGLRFAFREVWQDLAGWFFLGLILAGAITALVPDPLLTRYLGGGLPAMLLMLAFGIPLYICATASTPIAAALILKGVSPGAALVFLMAGPATNIAALTVILGLLGRRATAIYLGTIALGAVLCGLMTDGIYTALGWSAQALAGSHADILPLWCKGAAAVGLLLLSLPLLTRRLRSWRRATSGQAIPPVPAVSGKTPTRGGRLPQGGT
ncbi:MAG: SO_0444 family Cu/Zn efflux transporter [Desulfosarcinaceae bacterium]|nr:SO_0444 family Cu/Zn efflux transporter [Desulfosarcinaceae bacterium]